MLHGVGVDRETGSGFGRRFRKESEKMKKNGTKKINVVTLGCSKNVVDSEHLMAQLAAAGYEVVFDSNGTDARTVVVNTCGFIGDAKEESINTILGFVQAKEEGAIDRLFVIGCLSERYAEELRSEIPEVDDYFGARDFTAVVRALTGGEGSAPATERMLTTPAHYAYLKISEGCNWRCAYCAIPLIRGPHVSVPEEQVLEEARRLVARGVKELIVVAQDTTYYGVDLYGERRLAPLLRRLAALPGVEWVRLHYTYPTGFPVEVMEAMREESKICRYIDIPLQHIADRQLSAMRRGITKQGTEELIARLRREVPGIAIRTTLLVGFPGESEADFAELMEFVERQRFERLGVFPYSAEEGTPSAEMADDVPEEVKQERVERVMELQRNISLEANAAKVGRRLRVVVDRREGDYYVARSEYDSPEVDQEILLPAEGERLVPGEFREVVVTACEEYDLYGRLA
jgi:ribosomal protein S12 methylthiotransferase